MDSKDKKPAKVITDRNFIGSVAWKLTGPIYSQARVPFLVVPVIIKIIYNTITVKAAI